MTEFTASFTVSHPQWRSGIYNGLFEYSWPQNSFRISMDLTTTAPVEKYVELFSFNAGKGSTYDQQFLFKSSSTCPCEVNPLKSPLVPLYANDTFWNDLGVDPAVTHADTNEQCNKYQAKSTSSRINFMWKVPGTDGKVCSFTLLDGRKFVLKNVAAKQAMQEMSFIRPTDCKCGKPIDIVLSLDRTGSISFTEWGYEWDFTKKLVAAFEIGPLKANFAIVNWNANNWTTITMDLGTDQNAVVTAVNKMGCCGSGSCCCCGTPIGGGIWHGTTELIKSQRPGAAKFLFVLTDGCQNHKYDNVTGTAVACTCGGEQGCRSDPACVGDITKYYTYVKQLVPSVQVIAIGVGSDGEVCAEQLLAVAGGDQSLVFRPQSFQELLNYVQTLTATACDVTDQACSGCCGMCFCSKCYAPTGCITDDPCTPNQLSNGCCRPTVLDCPVGDACTRGFCKPGFGCTNTTRTCPDETDCSTYKCNTVTGVCDVTTKPACVKPPPVCTTTDLKNCTDNNACTVEGCDALFQCTLEGTRDAECTGRSDKCTTWVCNPDSTNANDPCTVSATVDCDDNNVCTFESCDPAVGCVTKNRNCTDEGYIGNDCNVVRCLPDKGCVIEPIRNCSDIALASNYNETQGNTTCWVGTCRNATCVAVFICELPPPPSGIEEIVITSASIGTAAIVGIIVAIIVGLAACGGGAYAVAQGAGGDVLGTVSNNPLYHNKTHFENPLHAKH
eukprot:TRINITY_DN10309_c1_g1_i1.p1 TRINITY_DN10309_c1_g1~~TRINITY_DN10309_c1_g1_i1.p1  ORF type:complete len:745 (+),score=163.46 TRINITY_DN10309_c1_g1_i1:59-2236(+)